MSFFVKNELRSFFVKNHALGALSKIRILDVLLKNIFQVLRSLFVKNRPYHCL